MERRSPLTKLQTEVADSLRWPLGTELYFYWELLYGIVIWNCYMELLYGTVIGDLLYRDLGGKAVGSLTGQ